MGIKYLEKTSLIDFPGIISSIIFFGGCNFKCSYCYNKPLVIKPELIPDITEEEIAGVLNERKNFIEGVVFTGGEPSIYPGLLDFIKKIKDLGLKIKLDTNGYRPDILQKAFSLDLLDYAAMDIKGPLDSYSELAGVEIDTGIIKESIDIVKGSLVPYEFRTTVWDGYFNKYNDDSLLELVKNSKHYFLHNYYSVDKDSIHVPADRSEIADFLIKAEKIVDKVDLRGNWE